MKQRPSNGSPLRKPVIFSAIVHLIVFITLFAVPGLRLPLREKPLKVDVMWVELPRGTSDDIGLGLKKSEGLPKSTIEEQKKLFQPEQPEQETLKPAVKAPVEKPVEKKPEKKAKPEKRPAIDTSKMTIAKKGAKEIVGKPAPKADRKIKDALAMIDKELSGRQVVPEAGQVEGSDGYKYGTSDKPLRVSPSDPEYLKYQAMVRARIIREWIVPSIYADDIGKRLSSRIEVMINMDGDVVSTRWISKSGNASFDQSAMRAVRKASPFPRPPDRLAWEAYNEGFLVEFDPRLKPR